MTPTPPAQEIEELTQRLIEAGCEGDNEQGCTRDDMVVPLEDWCINCLAGRALHALTAEMQARQQAERERDALRSALVGLVGGDGREELDAMEAMMRLMPAPDADKAVTINAIHALIASLP